jgi:hypothetical protein
MFDEKFRAINVLSANETGQGKCHELRDRFSVDQGPGVAEEWQARVELAACYRLVDVTT